MENCYIFIGTVLTFISNKPRAAAIKSRYRYKSVTRTSKTIVNMAVVIPINICYFFFVITINVGLCKYQITIKIQETQNLILENKGVISITITLFVFQIKCEISFRIVPAYL